MSFVTPPSPPGEPGELVPWLLLTGELGRELPLVRIRVRVSIMTANRGIEFTTRWNIGLELELWLELGLDMSSETAL
jgi:hypothetical protein